MDTLPRHRCFIYEGAPSRNLGALAAMVRKKLAEDYRCMYLNSEPMVAGMRSYLAATGLDIAHEAKRGSLVFSSGQGHLVDGRFDMDRMLEGLAGALEQALKDGFAGLFATGDMSWEFGPDRDFSKLVEYEWRLEEFFHEHEQLSGICQYHANTLPAEAMRHGVLIHPAIFVNETLSLINPRFLHPRLAPGQGAAANLRIA